MKYQSTDRKKIENAIDALIDVEPIIGSEAIAAALAKLRTAYYSDEIQQEKDQEGNGGGWLDVQEEA